MNWKWVGVIALYIIGVLAGVVAIIWLVEPIHSVPSFLGGHHVRGHFQRRGEALIVLAVVLLAVAIYLTVRFRREDALLAGATAGGRESATPAEVEQPEAAAAPAASATVGVEPEPAGTVETPVDNP
jgi:hypothetical protein